MTEAAGFAGRDRELARVTGRLEEARGGHGSLVLCTGEPGIGKTRLAEEITARAAALGMAVIWARASDPGTAPPYGLWRLAWGEHPASSDGERTQVPELWPAAAGPPAEQTGASGPAPDQAEVSGPDTDRERRFALFTDVQGRLAQIAGEAGLLVVLDDIQWADEPSLLLLRHLGRQLRGLRVLILATGREPGDGPPGTIAALAADGETERIELRRLDRAAIGELAIAAGLDAGQAGLLYAETGGNPFLIRELIRLWTDSPGAGPVAVPGTVLQSTAYRIGRLAPGTQEVLRAAAVLGTSFSAGVVAQMLGTPVLSLLGPAAEATAAGFLVDGDRPGDFRFAHALVRSAVAAQLSGPDQRRLHLAAVGAIEAFYAGQLRPHQAELARHLVLGSLPGDRLRAARACQAAGDVAAEDLAFEESARLFAQALSVGHDELAEADRDLIELARAAALYRGGDLSGWHEAVTGTARRAERRGDAWLLAQACLVMEATGEPAWDGELSRLCEQALSRQALPEQTGRGELPAGLRARVLARHAQALTYRGDHERAARLSRDALEVAERAGDPAVLVDALQARQLACSAPEGHAERAALAGRMLAVAAQTRDPSAEMWGRLWRLDTLFESGQLAIIARELGDLAACAERVRGPVARWHLLQCSAGLAFATGRYREAIRLAGQAFGVISEMGHPAAFGSYASFLGQAGLYVGSDASGAAALMAGLPGHLAPDAAARRDSLASVFPALSMALLALERGDRAGAAAAYEQAGPVRSWDPAPALRLPCWALGLTAAIGLGRTGDVAYLAGRLEPFRGRHVTSAAGAGPFGGPVELRLGQAAAARGDTIAAIADLETAVAVCHEIGAAGLAVEAEMELAAALLLRGNRAGRDRARTLLAEADRGAARLEMARLAARIAGLRGQLSAVRAVPLLSPREQEVAGLVGKGLTNRQIAAALVVSERTAQNHVQHILVKLGFSNRSQIAAWTMSTAMSNSHDGAAAELP